MGRRVGLLLALLALVVASAASGATTNRSQFASAEIRAVVEAGLMGPSVNAFRPDDPLTASELAVVVSSLGGSMSIPDPDAVVPVRELDARLVSLAGLRPEAQLVRQSALDVGISPRPWLGTETVARLLGLRVNHPQGSEDLERSPKQPASRAEAAYSLAKFRLLDAARIAAIQNLVSRFSVPTLTELQRDVLSRALRFVGYPYVFAGMSEQTQKLWSATAPGNTITVPGGFDCSGFVWRVYKLQPYPDAPALAAVFRGRTTYAMSGEVPKAERIDRAAIVPGDVIFFGSRGPASKPSEIGHMGIYVGNGWFVHSSSGGVTLQPLAGWYATTLAWARRPLAESGLT